MVAISEQDTHRNTETETSLTYISIPYDLHDNGEIYLWCAFDPDQFSRFSDVMNQLKYSLVWKDNSFVLSSLPLQTELDKKTADTEFIYPPVTYVDENTRKLAARIFTAYYDRLKQFCYTRLQNIHDAEDVVSQVFERALPRFSYVTDGNYDRWLFRIARNLLINRHRDTERGRFGRDDELLDYINYGDSDSTTDFEDSISHHKTIGTLVEVLSSLHPKDQTCLALFFGIELPHKTIGYILGTTELGSKSLLVRLRKKLKILLLESGEEELTRWGINHTRDENY